MNNNHLSYRGSVETLKETLAATPGHRLMHGTNVVAEKVASGLTARTPIALAPEVPGRGRVLDEKTLDAILAEAKAQRPTPHLPVMIYASEDRTPPNRRWDYEFVTFEEPKRDRSAPSAPAVSAADEFAEDVRRRKEARELKSLRANPAGLAVPEQVIER